MSQQVPVSADALAETEDEGSLHIVLADLAYQRLAIVNTVFYGSEGAGDRNWVLIDAGIQGGTNFIKRAAAKRFGEGARPAAMVLTHGHFDHVGCLETLAEEWDAPIYAHALEFPYLDGTSSYPPPDPTVGGGLMAAASKLYPRGPIDVRGRLKELPADGSVPHMPSWKWIHTPGHTQGHVSLWREADKVLVSGDAFITTAQESAFAVALQRPELHGPPMYYTEDWVAAKRSVCTLAGLKPALVISGHGQAMSGSELLAALQVLARDFDAIAVPKR